MLDRYINPTSMSRDIAQIKIYLLCFFGLNIIMSCASSKVSSDCNFAQDSNYYVYEIIDREKSGKLSDREIINLKKKLITSISTSIRSKAITQGKIVNEVGQSYFGSETQSVSVGFLTNTNVIYCKRGRDHIAALSINKRDFMIKAMSQYENEIRINLQKVNSALVNYDSSKTTFNKEQARSFNDKIQEIEALHGLVVIPDNYREEDINQYNDNLAQLSAMTTEYSKRSYVFDDEKREIQLLINTKDFKNAFHKISSLSLTYGENSREGLDLDILMDELRERVRTNWDINKRLINEKFKNEDFKGVSLYLRALNELTIEKSYRDQYEELYERSQKLYKKIEKNRLLNESLKNQEIFFGINATSSYGNVINDENTIALDENESNFNFDRFLPSYKMGYRLFFNPEKNFGILMNVRGHSFKSIEVTESDYVFPFNENFTEVQAGISYSVFDVSVGRFLEKSDISNESYMKTLSINMSLLTTDKRKKGEKNYINLYGGINVISDLKEVNYLNVNVGLNYHIRFNRKLSSTDKKYLGRL